ncbi:GTPase HflX [Alicyclobacillus sacchari]|uniref:GTPase HflX n=1 Tax=Alicyclobacillus sacchari TaxID=392010 RepID=UPI001AB02650|nr:GTPase HflX [Alicyclobacillus sacchari]
MTEQRDRVILAMCQTGRESQERVSYRRDELEGLCEAAGAQVIAVVTQKRPAVDPRTFFGEGKVLELVDLVERSEATLVVADRELSPAQVRNLERYLPCRVIDRTQLILDIFARRAITREGRVQVEMAQLSYLLPRLTGRGAEMSRLGGGIGTRGPGETKLELDRRRIRTRLTGLRRELEAIARQRATARDKRLRDVPTVALVGYTNAGKTTLQGRWVADKGGGGVVGGENRLFDTLDPAARQVSTRLGHPYVVIDTVGFVENLPHHLVEAFRSTLEEVRYADVIVIVVDAGHAPGAHLMTTRRVLADLSALDKPIITFFNKIDTVAERPGPDVGALASLYGSAAHGNLEELYQTVERQLELDEVRVTIHVREDDTRWQSLLRGGRIEHAETTASGEWQMTAVTSRKQAHLWQQMQQDGSEHDNRHP